MRRLSLYEALAEVLNPLNSTIVDVGCGDGSLVRHLADQGARAIGIEVSEEQLDRALKGKTLSDGSYRVGTGQVLPLEDNSADTVIEGFKGRVAAYMKRIQFRREAPWTRSARTARVSI
jgi:2-polyprenyl-3-methyl-5-hydroxy-6-metoxy-1,4-benzoquinol methylase